MTTPICEDGGPLREWAPLAALLQQIPAKIQNGIFTYDINFTCIDAVPEFIAVGTNYGIIYWYDREKQDLQRLRCENVNSKITCLRVISTVDYMVAAGNENGAVTVFQIPKNLPDSLPDSLKPKQKKQVEKYSISGLHKSAVTTVEWSKNGMKLFSGDHNGLVVLTEIDFYMHLSKSSELLNEKYSIVQLNYQHGLLLVSTTLRTILVNRNENNKVIQVGQKERKILGKLGAIFGCRQNHTQELVIYASRPSLRLWQADKTGTVLKTLIFKKDVIRTVDTEVELLNPAPESTKKNRGEPTFGIVLPFCEDLLVTYSNDIIYVVNPHTIAITSVVTDLRRVTDVACTKDEIFILEGERNIIRIAHYPENNKFLLGTVSDQQESASSFADISKPVTNGILELTSKLRESAIMPAIPFHKINPANLIQSVGVISTVNTGTDTNPIIHAEEAVEVPRTVPLDVNTPLLVDINNAAEYNKEIKKRLDAKQNLRRQIFQKISQQEFEDVVFTPEKKVKKLSNKPQNGNKDELSHCDNTGKATSSNENGLQNRIMHSTCMSLSVDDDFILKSERNLESIQQDVEDKEKLLADILDLDLDLSKYRTSTQINTANWNVNNVIDSDPHVMSISHVNDSSTELKSDENDEHNGYSDHTDTESGDDDVSYRTELKRLEELEECRRKLLQNKLNDPVLTTSDYLDTTKTSCTDETNHREVQFNMLSREAVTLAILEEDDWVLVKNDILL